MISSDNTLASTDYKEVSRVISLYAAGWRNNSAQFYEAFEEDAWIFYTDSSGSLNKARLTDCFEDWAKTDWVIEPEILTFTQVGTLATVTLSFNNKTKPEASFIDNLTLIKLGNNWKITNKTAIHHSDREALITHITPQ